MSRTLNQLIAASIDGGEDIEETSTPRVGARKEDVRQAAPSADLEDVEKLASALEFIGRRGLDALLDKQASAADPPPGTNLRQSHRNHTQKQVAPNSSSPSMKPPGYGRIPDNAKAHLRGAVDTSTQGKGTHHPALRSNEAAINYDKREKSKKVAPALAAVLDNSAFADGKLKENLSNASGKGDKNIKTAHDYQAIQAELARRSGRA